MDRKADRLCLLTGHHRVLGYSDYKTCHRVEAVKNDLTAHAAATVLIFNEDQSLLTFRNEPRCAFPGLLDGLSIHFEPYSHCRGAAVYRQVESVIQSIKLNLDIEPEESKIQKVGLIYYQAYIEDGKMFYRSPKYEQGRLVVLERYEKYARSLESDMLQFGECEYRWIFKYSIDRESEKKMIPKGQWIKQGDIQMLWEEDAGDEWLPMPFWTGIKQVIDVINY